MCVFALCALVHSCCTGPCCATATVGRAGDARSGRGSIRDGSSVSVASGDGLEFTFGTKADPSSPTINSVRVGDVEIGVEQPRLTGFEVRRCDYATMGLL